MKKLLITLFVLLVASPAFGAVLLYDDFEYNADNARSFVTTGPWTYVKAENTTETNNSNDGGRGWLTTVTSIPGFSGSFPTQGNRILKMAGLPGTTGNQTDFYLTGPAIPGDVWFQFWIYVNRYGNEMSEWASRDKFIYPCAFDYPCRSQKWLFFLGYNSYPPNSVNAPAGGAYLIERDNRVGSVYNGYTRGNETKLGQHYVGTRLRANMWQLVILHFDTTHTSTGNAYEAWIDGIKVTEWIDGVTPGFSWTIPSPGGHRVFRMPTTWPGANNNELYDKWVYMDDFVVATAASDLPAFGAMTPPVEPQEPLTGLVQQIVISWDLYTDETADGLTLFVDGAVLVEHIATEATSIAVTLDMGGVPRSFSIAAYNDAGHSDIFSFAEGQPQPPLEPELLPPSAVNGLQIDSVVNVEQ